MPRHDACTPPTLHLLTHPSHQHTCLLNDTQFQKAYDMFSVKGSAIKTRPNEAKRFVFPATIAGPVSTTNDRCKVLVWPYNQVALMVDCTLWRADTAAFPQAEDLMAAPEGTVVFVCATLGGESTSTPQ